MPEVAGTFRSFDAAERYFRQKINVPTQRWDELWQGQHARAFVVAGATKEALLTDLREAVDAAITKGETLDDFRKRFDDIVARNGWTGWKGEGSAKGRAWRTQLIYHQNLRTAYMAGRWEELQKFPYLKYKHNSTLNPREEHQAWNNKIIARDDPWWQTHYPPNGWGCRCSAIGISAARMRADGLKPDTPPPGGDGNVPPEFQYHVGEANVGRMLSEQDMAMWRDKASDAWEVLTPQRAADLGRPERIPLDPLPRQFVEVRKATPAKLRTLLRDALGGDEKMFELPVRDDFSYRVNASVDVLADHVDANRAAFAQLLPDVLENPFEVWQSFERHKGTGRVVLRTRYIRAFEREGKTPGVLVVVEAVKGQLQGWTIVPIKQMGYLENQRFGNLLYGR